MTFEGRFMLYVI